MHASHGLTVNSDYQVFYFHLRKSAMTAPAEIDSRPFAPSLHTADNFTWICSPVRTSEFHFLTFPKTCATFLRAMWHEYLLIQGRASFMFALSTGRALEALVSVCKGARVAISARILETTELKLEIGSRFEDFWGVFYRLVLPWFRYAQFIAARNCYWLMPVCYRCTKVIVLTLRSRVTAANWNYVNWIECHAVCLSRVKFKRRDTNQRERGVVLDVREILRSRALL